jgi:ribonucleoside-diphosphate reductase alpha chain
MKIIGKKIYKEKTTVFDIQVEGSHNFAATRNRIIVHNSTIRPRGSFIHGVGVESPGAVKFMELFDKSSEIVTQGSGKTKNNNKGKTKIRKGAMMGILDSWHPDIMEFITAKQSPGRLTKFNISVNCSDEFMQRLNRIDELKQLGGHESEIEQLDKWDLIFPETTFERYNEEWDGDITAWKNKGYPIVVYETVSITKLWDLIMQSTYNRAEPGVVFSDRANDLNPFYYGEKIAATNPCLVGETKVDIRVDGQQMYVDMKTLDEMFHSEDYAVFEVYSMNTQTGKREYRPVVNSMLTSKSAKVIKVTDSETGKSITCTPDHRIWTQNRGYVMAKDLKENDILTLV